MKLRILAILFVLFSIESKAEEICLPEEEMEERFELAVSIIEATITLSRNYEKYTANLLTLFMVRISTKEAHDSELVQYVDREINSNFKMLLSAWNVIEEKEKARDEFEKYIKMAINLRKEHESVFSDEPIYALAEAIGYSKSMQPTANASAD